MILHLIQRSIKVLLTGDSRPFVDTEDNTHGLSCGGLIAAKIRNGIGVQGIAPNCNLWNCRISYDPAKSPPPGGVGFITFSIEACQFCIQNGCHVISESYASAQYIQAFADAFAALL